ncbi:hypothetical protein [Aeromicrobium chenweiae]|uniref:Uncharacterized protein n=1 Tax=Aeromicrobium chenweiae TaxID=2079793 RepID=A0A2S0WR21_9ACTN|nr:hypothetical protein [Aeromicrobium chenweiae]AWB93674.1 hypothetical protein C3E78_16450 [Aeromicrobium chenweiae]TGN30478.1 hypothetical protein E4L97_17545 [Aeromicrobium chenweiae]
MTATAPRRPPLLTAACAYLGGIAAIQSIRAISLVSTWNAENGAEKVSPQLEALRDSGISQASAESGYKVFLTVLAVLAAAGVVFAIYTARGDRASRIGLTVVMGLVGLFFFLGATGGSFFDAVLGALAIAFTVRLWTGESKAWFRALAGGAPADATTTADRRPDPFSTPPQSPVEHPAAQPPAAQHPAAQEPVQQPYPGTQQYWNPQPSSEKLPRSVGIAVWTTFVGSIVAGLGSALMLLTFVVAGTDYDSVIAQGGIGVDMIKGQESQFNTAVRFLIVMSSISLVASAAGLFASIRVLVTKRSGGVFLFVMTVVTIVISIIGFPIGLPWTVASVVALIQLRQPEAKQWFAQP